MECSKINSQGVNNMSIVRYGNKSRRRPGKKTDNTLDEIAKKVPEHACFYVEQELSSYPIYKLALAQLELDLEDIINQYGQVPTDAVTSHTGPGDPVNMSALRALIIEEKIKYYLSRIRRIDSGLNLLTEKEKKIANRKYFTQEGNSIEEVIEEFELSRCYFYKIRQEIIYKFAMIFGIL